MFRAVGVDNLRLGATRRAAPLDDDRDGVFALSRGWPSGASSAPARCRAASSRCWRSRRALMSRPRLLLLDEPSLGLAPLIVRQIFEAIGEHQARQRRDNLLVEQNATTRCGWPHRGYVLEKGEMGLGGTGQELLANAEVRAAYLEGGAA